MDVREKYVMQKINRKENSICPNCVHHNLCIAENNQPCFECNRFIDAHGVTVQECARPLEEWGEDYGDVLWWKFPIEEPPYVGSPLDEKWPEYHTHWTPIVMPKPPKGE